MTHTPGPWENRTPGKGNPGTIYAEGEYICTTSGNAQANAHLIAAAPALLEALEMLTKEPLGDFIYDIREHEMKGWDGPRVKNWRDAVMKVQAAIAKAKP